MSLLVIGVWHLESGDMSVCCDYVYFLQELAQKEVLGDLGLW